MIKRNKMTIEQIEEDRDKELKEIRLKNDENKNQVQDMALKSKAELQLIKSKMQDIETESNALRRTIADQTTAVEKQEKIL